MFLEDDIKKHIPIVIDTYCELLGEDCREMITQKFDKLDYFIYYNSDCLKTYYEFLLTCKKKELAIKFLDLIGVDTSKNKNKSFAEPLDAELDELLEKYLGQCSYNSIGSNTFSGFNSFRIPPATSSIKKNRIEFINFLRSSSATPNTVDITEESKQLESKIQLCINSYDKIVLEFQKYKSSLDNLEQLILSEKEQEEKFKSIQKAEFLKEVKSILPFRLKFYMLKHKLKISDIFDSSNILEEKSNIEYFSKIDNELLDDPDVCEEEKEEIEYFRKKFFSSLGFDVNIDEDSYQELIKRDDVKKLIPSANIGKKINNIKCRWLEQAQKKYYLNKFDFKTYSFSFTEAYNLIKNNSICIATIEYLKTYYNTLFFTLRHSEQGMLDYAILHELFHALSTFFHNNASILCFDIIRSNRMSPYNKIRRKYECFNENITDIFALLALTKLRKKDIYILDRKNQTKSINEIETHNTTVLTKRLLRSICNKLSF